MEGKKEVLFTQHILGEILAEICHSAFLYIWNFTSSIWTLLLKDTHSTYNIHYTTILCYQKADDNAVCNVFWCERCCVRLNCCCWYGQKFPQLDLSITDTKTTRYKVHLKSVRQHCFFCLHQANCSSDRWFDLALFK